MFREEFTCKMLASRIYDNPSAPNGTYSSGESWRERDPGNEPRHYGPPVCAIFIVAVAAAWIVHRFHVVCLLVHNPIVGQQDAGDGSKLGTLVVEFRG